MDSTGSLSPSSQLWWMALTIAHHNVKKLLPMLAHEPIFFSKQQVWLAPTPSYSTSYFFNKGNGISICISIMPCMSWQFPNPLSSVGCPAHGCWDDNHIVLRKEQKFLCSFFCGTLHSSPFFLKVRAQIPISQSRENCNVPFQFTQLTNFYLATQFECIGAFLAWCFLCDIKWHDWQFFHHPMKSRWYKS